MSCGGVVWCGVVWCGVVFCSVLLCCVVLCPLLFCSVLFCSVNLYLYLFFVFCCLLFVVRVCLLFLLCVCCLCLLVVCLEGLSTGQLALAEKQVAVAFVPHPLSWEPPSSGASCSVETLAADLPHSAVHCCLAMFRRAPRHVALREPPTAFAAARLASSRTVLVQLHLCRDLNANRHRLCSLRGQPTSLSCCRRVIAARSTENPA